MGRSTTPNMLLASTLLPLVSTSLPTLPARSSSALTTDTKQRLSRDSQRSTLSLLEMSQRALTGGTRVSVAPAGLSLLSPPWRALGSRSLESLSHSASSSWSTVTRRTQHAMEVSQKLASTTSSAPVASTLRSRTLTREGNTPVRPALETRELPSPQSCPLSPRARRL